MSADFLTIKNDSSQIYLDHNATTPLARSVSEQLGLWARAWGNPSSIHQSGRGPKALIREARLQIAELVGCHPLEIVFTSGGSEANNLALKGNWFHLSGRQARFIMSSVEHPSVTKTLQFLQKQGVEVCTIPVDRAGRIDLVTYESLLKEKPTQLVSVMYGNNETGSLFPVKEVARLAHAHGALFHCDMVQALGKVDIDLQELDVDYASFSAHKFYSLKGCGFLYVKKGRPLESLIHGGAQERSRRAGTENALAIAALGEMAKYKEQVPVRAEQMRSLRDHIQSRIKNEITGVSFTGDGVERLPNALSAVIEGVDGETLLMNLDMKGFAVSTGAACSSGSPEPSPVLLAMGLSREEAQSSLRLSLGWQTTLKEANLFVDALIEIVARLRSFQHGEKAAHGL